MAHPTLPFDHIVRVISIFATSWRYPSYEEHQVPAFELGWLAEFYPLFRDQLPQLLTHHRDATVTFTSSTEDMPTIDSVDVWLFALPSDQVVAALSLACQIPDLNANPTPTVRILEPLGYGEVSIDGVPLAQHVATLAHAAGAQAIGGDDGSRSASTSRSAAGAR
jgi:hypothetical protein